MPASKSPASNGTGEGKGRSKSSNDQFQMEVVEDETREDHPLDKSTDAQSKCTGNGNGVLNRAFEDEEKGKAINGNSGIEGNGHQVQHHTVATNGDVEMIPLTTSATPTHTPPPGDRKKGANGQQKNSAVQKSGADNKSNSNNQKSPTSNDLYTDYFMPVNNRRKLLRGQKLYVTRDQRAHKRGWKWIAFWGGVCTFVAAALLTGILAATGIIMSKEEPSFSGAQSLQSNETENSSTNWNTITDNNTGHGVILPVDNETKTSTTLPPSTSTTESSLHTSLIANTLEGELRLIGLDFNSEFTDITSATSRNLAKKIESELLKTFATMNVMNARVEQFSQGSVIVHFILSWPESVYAVTPEQAATYFTDHLSINGDNLGEYQIDPGYFTLRELSNRCEQNNGGCSDFCQWASSELKFTCSCDQAHVLDMDQKSCITPTSEVHTFIDHHTSVTHLDPFSASTHEDHTSSFPSTETPTTTPRTTSGSRGRHLVIDSDDDESANNGTQTVENDNSTSSTEPVPQPEPEPGLETTSEGHDSHLGFGLDIYNSSTPTITPTRWPATELDTTTPPALVVHDPIPVSENGTSNITVDTEDFPDVTSTIDSIHFTLTTPTSVEMNFTVPHHDSIPTEEHIHGSNVSHSTHHITDGTITTTSFNITEPALPISFNSSIDEETFSTWSESNVTMAVTSDLDEIPSTNFTTTGHGWDRFSHMLTSLNEATASDSEDVASATTESYLLPENYTQDNSEWTHFTKNTSHFSIEDAGRMLPDSGTETPVTVTESPVTNLTAPTLLNSSKTTVHDAPTFNTTTKPETTPWTAVSYSHLYTLNATEVEIEDTIATIASVAINSTPVDTFENSSTTHNQFTDVPTQVNATTEEPATLTTVGVSVTLNETVTDFSIISNITNFSNHETSASLNPTQTTGSSISDWN